MTQSTKADFGMLGMAVMGKNLAMNVADHGFSVSVWNRNTELMQAAVADSEGKLTGYEKLEEFVDSLEKPRRIMLMIMAGKPVDMVLESLKPLLDEGDIIIEGGNSFFKDTQRREAMMRGAGFNFFGVGVSGGEEGARYGPSMMPGGDAQAYERIRPILESIATSTESGPCVTHVGSDGAGHFVKMVHNGIEYADMQFIAEAYHLMRDMLRLDTPDMADVFYDWNQGLLESFLIEITAKILTVPDGEGGGWLVEKVLDKAGQKGTGRWTAQVALDLGIPVPSIAAAIDARVLSSLKDERLLYSQTLRAPMHDGVVEFGVEDVHDALYAAKIGAYAQGMALIMAASKEYDWNINPREIARIWKGGCIIRAKFLDTMMQAWEQNPELPNLLLDPSISEQIHERQGTWRRVVSRAIEAGIPVPGMAASLSYYDALRSASLPQNMIQAQRDAFGAHTYLRVDEQNPKPVHTNWLA